MIDPRPPWRPGRPRSGSPPTGWRPGARGRGIDHL